MFLLFFIFLLFYCFLFLKKNYKFIIPYQRKSDKIFRKRNEKNKKIGKGNKTSIKKQEKIPLSHFTIIATRQHNSLLHIYFTSMTVFFSFVATILLLKILYVRPLSPLAISSFMDFISSEGNSEMSNDSSKCDEPTSIISITLFPKSNMA